MDRILILEVNTLSFWAIKIFLGKLATLTFRMRNKKLFVNMLINNGHKVIFELPLS